MSAARCVHGRPIARDDGSGCELCGLVAQRTTVAVERVRGDARTERDRGLAAALAEPAAQWDAQVVDQAIRHLASSGGPFSANDIRPLLPAVSGSVIGTRFMVLARRGLIERVGSELTSHAAGHARRVSVWRGTSTNPATVPAAREPEPPSSRPAPETVAEKARRLLAAGGVRVRLVDDDGRVAANVQGDGGRYTVRRTAAGRWWCSCKAGRHGTACAHVAAVGLVVAA